MRNLIRSPLAWAVVAEMFVVAALLVLAWNVIGSVARSGIAMPAVSTPDGGASPDEAPLPDIPTVTGQRARGPLPGLNESSAFWRQRLVQLNRDQAAFARLEWRIVRAGMDAVRDYLEGVVLPAVRRAEGAVS
jgi:hypothetical protein